MLAPAVATAQAIPFHTPTALPIPLAESGIRVWYQRTVMSSLYMDGERALNPDDMRVTADAVPVMVPYGIRPRTHVIVGLPYVRRRFREGDGSHSNASIGDATIAVKQELMEADFVGGNRRLAVFGELTLPTGQTREGGEALLPPLRTGAGVTTVGGQLVYSHVHRRLGAHVAGGYGAALGSEQGVRPGDRLTYDVALGYRLYPRTFRAIRDANLNAYLELNGIVERPATANGARLSDTGGHAAFLSPGLQFIPLPNWAAEASVQIPVVRAPRGRQLVADWSLAIGVRALFSLPGF